MSNISVSKTGLYKVCSEGVTQYVWIVAGDVSIEAVRTEDVSEKPKLHENFGRKKSRPPQNTQRVPAP